MLNIIPMRPLPVWGSGAIAQAKTVTRQCERTTAIWTLPLLGWLDIPRLVHHPIHQGAIKQIPKGLSLIGLHVTSLN